MLYNTIKNIWSHIKSYVDKSYGYYVGLFSWSLIIDYFSLICLCVIYTQKHWSLPFPTQPHRYRYREHISVEHLSGKNKLFAVLGHVWPVYLYAMIGYFFKLWSYIFIFIFIFFMRNTVYLFILFVFSFLPSYSPHFTKCHLYNSKELIRFKNYIIL